jgi:hypothetical protein
MLLDGRSSALVDIWEGTGGNCLGARLFPQNSMVVVIVNEGKEGAEEEGPGSFEAAWDGCGGESDRLPARQ